MFKKAFKLTHVLFFSLLAISCSNRTEQSPLYTTSASLNEFKQASFENYLSDTKHWLENNRTFISNNKELELAANMPFEIVANNDSIGQNKKGVLLVHGLSDSPFYFRDIAQALAKKGFLVRSILIPGHGSKPADLVLAKYKDWREIVSHHTKLLQQEVEEVWLGGFSTGANLVTSEAIENNRVAGLFLISPAFKPGSSLTKLLPLANIFTDWIDKDPADGNYTRFNSVSTNGATQYYYSSQKVVSQLEHSTFNKPVILAISEHDEVINTDAVKQLFKRKFTHPKSQLLWFGQKIENTSSESRIKFFDTHLPQHKISNFSHMSLLFKPSNHFYGINGQHRICENGQTENIELLCQNSEVVWYSSWGYQEPEKVHARLTWNPYFKEMINAMDLVTSQQ